MLRVSDFLWFVFFGVVAGRYFVGATGIREDIAVIRICNATDPVDLNVFNNYMMHHDFDDLGSHSRKLSCFLLCIYTEYKWMTRHGSFRLNKIKSWMRRANLPIDDEEILLHKCITTELSDPCSRARHLTECFWYNHQGMGSSDGDRHALHAMMRKKDAM